MARTVSASKNRDTIYDFLSRAKRFHASVSSVHYLEVGELMAALEARRAAGRPVSFLATLVKATALVMERYPRMNHHLFHGVVRRREVEFEQICCTLVVMRKQQRELTLLPLNIERPDRLSVDEIHALIQHTRTAPLDELPQFRGMQQMKKLPRPAMRLFSYLCRSSPGFYRKFFGTYGISPLIVENDHGVIESVPGFPSSALANACTAFFPASVGDHARVEDGQVVVKKILTLMMALDHYVVDGHDGFMAVRYLEKLLARPEKLGL